MARRAAIAAALILLLSAAYASGFLEILADRERTRGLLEALGFWGPVLYVLAFALLEPFFVPGFLFVLGATAIWPFWPAYVLSLAGAIGAGVVGFSFARFMARDWVESKLPERFRQYDERLAGATGFRTVMLVRLMFFIAPPAHWVLGLSKVRFGPFLAGTAIGFAPGIALLTWACLEATDWIAEPSFQPWILVLLPLGIAFAVYRRRREAAKLAAAS
jgi:uncharacterized membrane protein YdjX (TVP38/TMEM64 family)